MNAGLRDAEIVPRGGSNIEEKLEWGCGKVEVG